MPLWPLTSRVLELASAFLVQFTALGRYPPRWHRAFSCYLVRHVHALLLHFCVFTAALTAVLAHLILSTASAYGLSHLGMQWLIQVLALELIPFCAMFFVALHSGIPDSMRLYRRARRSADPSTTERRAKQLFDDAVARALACFCAGALVTLVSACTVLVVSYLARYGLSLAALPAFIRVLGQILSPVVCLILALKSLFSLLAVSLLPAAASLAHAELTGAQPFSTLRMLTWLMVAMAVIEALALMGHYY